MADQMPSALRRRRASIALICVGLLILIPSGLCTAYFSVALPGTTLFGRDQIWVSLLIGGLPILFGAVLLFIGLRLRRR